MRVADYLMSRLADAGAAHVFLLPGGGAMYLNDALVCEKRLTPVPCHHEQACGIASEAWGRVRETFGVCMVTTGPGATNVITPVAGAWIESIPMLVISGQVKRPDRLAGRPLRQGGVQEVDIVPMVKTITKYAVTVDDPKQIRYHLERALFEMKDGRNGPVWLDIPLDVQAAPINPDELPGFTPDVTPATALNALAGEIMAMIGVRPNAPCCWPAMVYACRVQPRRSPRKPSACRFRLQPPGMHLICCRGNIRCALVDRVSLPCAAPTLPCRTATC
jgi:acetolactate synthase-1/2/3 large subunit